MLPHSAKILGETLDLAVLATKEIDMIKEEIDTQNEKLLHIQKRSGETDALLDKNNTLLDNIFRNTKFSYVMFLCIALIIILLLILINLSLF